MMDNGDKRQQVHVGMKFFKSEHNEIVVAFPIMTHELLAQLRKDGLSPHKLNCGEYDVLCWTDAPSIDIAFVLSALQAVTNLESQGFDLLVTEDF